jgi:hypothetical protein
MAVVAFIDVIWGINTDKKMVSKFLNPTMPQAGTIAERHRTELMSKILPEIYNADDMMELCQCSRPTLGKKTQESREGLNDDIPPPFTRKGQRPLWCAETVRLWIECRQSKIPSSVNVQVRPTKKQVMACQEKERELKHRLDVHRRELKNTKHDTRAEQ